MSTRPRLFLFMPYIPYPVDRGTYQRVFHLFTELSKTFAIDLACLHDEAESPRSVEPLKAWAERVIQIPHRHPPWRKLFPDRLLDPLPTTVRHWQDPEIAAELEGFVAGQEYALVQFIDLVLWPYIETLFPDHPARIMDRSRIDWLFQLEELRTLHLSLRERLLRRENLRKIRQLERIVMRKLRGMIVCGTDDRSFLEEKLGTVEKVFVLPNGFNPEYFDATTFPPNRSAHPSILFCGALDYSPNVDGIEWFLETVWPDLHARHPELEWRIVGKSPTASATRWAEAPGVTLVGEVPDVRPEYQRAWLQIVPLRIGGGTRLKIVESLGMRTPVVSTTLGAQGLELADDHDILLGDTPTDLADAVSRLVQSPEDRSRIEEAGYQTVHARYRWDRLGAALADHLQTLLPV